jgi:ABC-2 type transport system permease protein
MSGVLTEGSEGRARNPLRAEATPCSGIEESFAPSHDAQETARPALTTGSARALGDLKTAFLLFGLSLKRARLLLGAMGLLLALVQVLRVRIAEKIYDAGQFDQLNSVLSSYLREIIGSALGSIMSFNGIVCGVYFDTGYIIALLALVIALSTLPASERETGFADLILARPVARHWLITRTIALVLFSIVLMLALMAAGTWAGLMLFAPDDAPWPTVRQILALALTLGALLSCWSGVAMAFGAACRRGVASATTSLMAFLTLILDWAHRAWPPLDWLDWLSPFRYFSPYDLVAGKPLQWDNLLVLWAIAATGYILAYLIISQRDISR